jgi:hypothetical protein
MIPKSLTKIDSYLSDKEVDDSDEARELAEKQRIEIIGEPKQQVNNYGGREGSIEKFIFPTRGSDAPHLVRVDEGENSDFTQSPPTTPGGGGEDLIQSLLIPPPSLIQKGDEEIEYREVVVGKNGQARQAGADTREGEFIQRYRRRAEESLFVFLKGIMGRFFLTDHFHLDTCRFLQQCPPFRKLVLMPREHCKTGIVAGGIPGHILIQSAKTNRYFPGLEGSECRILLAGETEKMAKKNLRVVKNVFEENKVFRALWPERVWDKPKQQSKEWSTESIIIPRENEWPDPTIRAVGVGGAITGSRPNVLLKDDLISFKAANSEVVMDEAIEWHKASRALLDKYEVESGLQSLEFIIGTKWAVFDLYSHVLEDPSVEANDEKYRKIVSDGKILWPEKYTQEDIEQLMREHGSMFYLLYLNNASDPELTDFDMEQVRTFWLEDGKIMFEGDARDAFLKDRMEKLSGTGEAAPIKPKRGELLTKTLLNRMIEASGGGMRLRG